MSWPSPSPRRTAAGLLAWLGAFGEHCCLRVAPKQAAAYVAVARRFCFHGSAGLDRAGLEAYLAGRRRQGVGLKSLHNEKSALAAFAEFLVGRGVLSENPARLVRLAPLEKPLPAFLEDNEIGVVLGAAAAAGILCEVLVALGTGLRTAEICRLRWADVDLAGGQLRVWRAKGRRFRVVDVPTPVLSALAGQRAAAGHLLWVFPARLTWRGGWRYDDRPRSAKALLSSLAPVRRAVAKFSLLPPGSVGRGWHLFRHTFATRLCRQDVNLRKVQGWLGHASSLQTERYAHLAARRDPAIERALPDGFRVADLPSPPAALAGPPGHGRKHIMPPVQRRSAPVLPVRKNLHKIPE